jgi:sulfofructose kinase
MTRFDVLGVGANSLDFVTLLPAHPQPSGPRAKMRMLRQEISPGGQTATALATCASFGLRAQYVGAVGSDANGERMHSALQRLAVDLSHVVVREGRNQFALILIDSTTGERIVLWDRDETLCLNDRDLPDDVIADARLVHVDDVDQEAAIRAATSARKRGVPVTSDIDRINDRTDILLRAVTVPIMAEHVPEQLTGIADPERALRKLRAGSEGLLCVTLGVRGALALDGDQPVYSPGFPVHAVDTTGAGDVFRGGFIYGLLQQWPVERVLRFANAAAAVSCTRLGAINGVPTLEETLALVASPFPA